MNVAVEVRLYGAGEMMKLLPSNWAFGRAFSSAEVGAQLAAPGSKNVRSDMFSPVPVTSEVPGASAEPE